MMDVALPTWMMLLCLGVTISAVAGVAALAGLWVRRQSGGDLAQRVAALERAVRRLEDEWNRSSSPRTVNPSTDIRE